MDDNQKGFLYLFERPFEPLDAPRANGMIQFQQTLDEDEAVDNAMVSMGKSSDTRFGDGAMIMNIPMIPNLCDQMENVNKVPKGVPYSHFDPVHVEAVKELTQFFMDSKYVDMPNCWQYWGSVKDNVNEGIFIYALSCFIIRNPAIDSRLVPAIYEVFPNNFIPQNCMDMVRDTIANPDEPKPEPVNDVADFSGTDTRLEHRVKYWRDDYGMNAHHWHWHLVFPHHPARNSTEKFETRDRQGELFYYMHNQMLGRYDWERLSNGLARVVPLDVPLDKDNLSKPIVIPDGYKPDLTYSTDPTKHNASRNYPARPDNATLDEVDSNELKLWRKNIQEAIRYGYVIKKRTSEPTEHIPLCDNVADGKKRGINILGDTLEPNHDSPDELLYGSLHNTGHRRISELRDPEENSEVRDPEENPEPANDTVHGVMRYTEIAMRDPVFYRWHKFIDDICQQYKMKQEQYDENELIFGSVLLECLSVKSDECDDNVLETGWTYTTIDCSRGLDFRLGVNREGELESELGGKLIAVRTQHLTHKPFTYNLQVTNNETEPKEVTVRLYMAPKFDEKGETMSFEDQRLLWAEMDRYHCTLKPGLNSLERKSTESSITILGNMTFRRLETYPLLNNTEYCGCGWPQHLLLPKGTVEGMDFQIFALISDGDLDKVKGSCGKKTCSNAASYCGILDEMYPDARPMGYPFDRCNNSTCNDTNIENAYDFACALPNATMTDIKIFFKDEDLKVDYRDKDLFPE